MPNSNSALKAIAAGLSKRRLFYVCRDIERAVGIDPALQNYRIITNYSDFSASLARQHSHIILIKEKEQSRRKVGIPTSASGLLDTIDLLKHPMTQKNIKKDDYVLVFKNNALIENICQKNNWRLLNPDSKLADKIESKISQVKWLGNLAKYLPPHKVDACGNIKWRGKTFILQFNHSHTGSGTILIDSEKKLGELKLKFSKREVRIMDFIKGPVFTNNNVVWGNKILTGNINYQITGLPPFTDNKFATIGNDWALPHKILSKKQIQRYKKIATEIGIKLKKDGWKGLYGVDIIVDEKTGQLYLLEINARQPASTTFESQLQATVIPSERSDEESLSSLSARERVGRVGADTSATLSRSLLVRGRKSDRDPSHAFGMTNTVTTFEAHLSALLNIPARNYKLIDISEGAQIIQRITKKITGLKTLKLKKDSILNIIIYKNNLPGSDLVRIQCDRGLMQKDNMLNILGKTIKTAVISANKK